MDGADEQRARQLELLPSPCRDTSQLLGLRYVEQLRGRGRQRDRRGQVLSEDHQVSSQLELG